MNDGHRQRQMVQKLKTQVKQDAKRRRGIALIENIAQTLAGQSNDLDELSPRSIPRQSRSFVKTGPPLTDMALFTTRSPQLFDRALESLTTPPTYTTNKLEMGYLMGCMEYVFPILFPFYNPAILEGGRSWPVMLALKSVGFSKSVTSLSSYFFSAIPVVPGPVHNACFTKTWHELSHQTNMALTSVQHDLQHLQSQGIDSNLRGAVHLLANIVQLLVLERELFTSSEWQVHLKAATGLLEQILLHHGVDNPGQDPSIAAVVEKLADPIPLQASTSTPLNPEQAAFLFFSTIMVVEDIVISTYLDQHPKLRRYLAEEGPRDPRHVLRVETLTGCQGWVFQLLGDTTTLNTWKKIKWQNSQLVTDQLHHRVKEIDQRWQDGIKHLDQRSSWRRDETDAAYGLYGPLESVLRDSNYTYAHAVGSSGINTGITQIWAYAARTLLLITLLGWQPTHQDIVDCVEHTVNLLNDISSPSWLRLLIWPICVTGCIAVEQQRPTIRSILDKMGALGALGSVRSARSIIESVWAQQELDVETWDFTTCFNLLEHTTLLV
ncbi:C6 transcription factor [Fusarium albosuccineum]|uniref:C6 transcription factor n=1 Tax=Fusarium albosuccineum TaxID=1237068 RepID=A0A8H4LC75_9HYPO|nr:C6 transcription factor [Fusarium albosuccineum]